MADSSASLDARATADGIVKNNWAVWKAMDKLKLRQKTFYPKTTSNVIRILTIWGLKWQGNPSMASLLNKSTLHHEIEETIVVIHYLIEALDRRPDKSCIVIDACAGKGMLSFLLSYLKHPKIRSIVMLEKATIDWSHIEESNKIADEEMRPRISIWENTNLHDYDDVLDRMLALKHPIAMCGIHLCKQLGPSFCGLYNGLGSSCIYGCLSPCCMPRAVTTQKRNAKKRKEFTLSIQLAETVEERRDRRNYMLRRDRLRRKPITGPCYYCKVEGHSIYGCEKLKALPKEEQVTIRRAWYTATVPCWICMEIGHFKDQCPNVGKNGAKSRSSAHNAQHPPMKILDVTDILKAPKPYYTYCQVLADGFQKGHKEKINVRVIETNLEKLGNHDISNWNSERKSIFIIVE